MCGGNVCGGRTTARVRHHAQFRDNQGFDGRRCNGDKATSVGCRDGLGGLRRRCGRQEDVAARHILIFTGAIMLGGLIGRRVRTVRVRVASASRDMRRVRGGLVGLFSGPAVKGKAIGQQTIIACHQIEWQRNDSGEYSMPPSEHRASEDTSGPHPVV